MSEVRPCVYILVAIVCLQLVAGKPIFGTQIWCDFFCDDEDIISDSSSTTSVEDLVDALFGTCEGCPLRRRSTTTRPPTANPGTGGQNMPPFNLMIPPSNGMNVSLSNNGGSWWLNMIPWGAPPGGAPTSAPPAATPAPAATTAAGAPAATTAAAPTTAKK